MKATYFTTTLASLCNLSLVIAQCVPSSTTFGSTQDPPYVPMNNDSSYAITQDGLEMYLRRPENVHKHGNINNKEGYASTINSTFSFRYARITLEIQAPAVAGAVTAAITMGVNSGDEIDIELLGGVPDKWDTNVFAPTDADPTPHYSALDSTEDISDGDITTFHKYTIDWAPDYIEWSIDGNVARTLPRDQSRINGEIRFPTRESRLQFGIWDASGAEGTSEWAKGPIDWNKAGDKITATVKSISVECPYV